MDESPEDEQTELNTEDQDLILKTLDRKYGWKTLIGGFFIHMMLGCLYSYGNLCLYVSSIYYKYDNFSEWGYSISEDLKNSNDYEGDYSSYSYFSALLVFPLQLLFISISMPVGVKILQGSSINKEGKVSTSNSSNYDSLNPALIFHNAESMMPIWAPMTIGSVFMIGGVFLSSFVLSNKILFTILHGVFFGIGYGLWYMAPIIASYKFFPQNQGFVNGVIMMGFSFGSFIYWIIVLLFVKNWVDPILHIKGGYIFNMWQSSITGGFGDFISTFNWIMWTFWIIWTCLSITSLILLYDRDDILEIKLIEIMNDKFDLHSKSAHAFDVMDDEGLRERGVNVKIKWGSISSTLFYRSYYFKEGIVDSSFLQLIVMMIFSSTYLISIIFLFKPMIETGKLENIEKWEDNQYNLTLFATGDNILILVDAIANFLWGVFRIIWGYLVDYAGFRTWYTIIVSMEIILIIISLMITDDASKYWNLINILASYVLIGGHFAIFPAVFSKIFGNKLGSMLYSLSFIGYALSSFISLLMYYIWSIAM